MKKQSSDLEERMALTPPARSWWSMWYRTIILYALVASIVVLAIANRDKIRGMKTVDQPVVQTTKAVPRKAARVVWKRLQLSQLKLRPSSFDCDEADPLYQSCIFHNIVLFQARLFYILPDNQSKDSFIMPNPAVFDTDTATMSLDEYSTVEVLNIITRSELIARIEAANGKENPTLKVSRHKLGVFQRIRSFTNWYWMLNSASNTYHRICKYLNACTYDEVRKVAWLQPAAKTQTNARIVGHLHLKGHTHSTAANDLRKCLGPLFWVDHPSHSEYGVWVNYEMVIMDKVLFGVGDDTVQPNAALKIRDQFVYAPTNHTMSLRRVQFLRKCADLPPLPAPHTNPNIVLINRPFADGRSIIGLDDVYDRLKHLLPPDVSLTLYYPRGGMAFHEQAAAFDNASVLVIPHGAATANFVFLPLDAVVLDVFAMSTKHEHDKGIMGSLPLPPYNLTMMAVNCSMTTEPFADGLKRHPLWGTLTVEQQKELLSHTTVDGELEIKVKEWLNMQLLDFMDYRAYHPNAENLTQAVLDAVALWKDKTASRREWELNGGYEMFDTNTWKDQSNQYFQRVDSM